MTLLYLAGLVMVWVAREATVATMKRRILDRAR